MGKSSINKPVFFQFEILLNFPK